MLEESLVDDLAASPPQVWAQRIRQSEVIGPLAKKKAITASEMTRACAVLGVRRRRFYQLLKAMRDQLAGGPARGHQTGVHYRIDELKEQIIANAISLAGSSARQAKVCGLVLKLSTELGIEPPSISAVRYRFSTHRRSFDLVNRFKLTCDIIADLCPLVLPVLDEAKEPVLAWLLIIIDAETGHFMDHVLFAGKPSGNELSELIVHPRNAGMQVGYTAGLIDLLATGHAFASQPGKAASPSRKLAGGSVLRAVCGRAIGRVLIRTHEKEGFGHDIPPVSINYAQAVIRRLLAQHNAIF